MSKKVKSRYSITEITQDKGSLQFILAGSYEEGLDKSIVNAIRRTLLSEIPTVAFDTDEEAVRKDLKMVTNHSSLHNEMLLHRFSLIPLALDPDTFLKQYLFECHVKHDKPEPFRFVTSNDMNIYPLTRDLQERVENYLDEGVDTEESEAKRLLEILDEISPDNYQLDKPLTQKEKDVILRPFEFRGNKHYCFLNELKHTGTEGVHQEIHCFGSPSVKSGSHHSRYQAVSQASYSFVRDEALVQSTLEAQLSAKQIANEDKDAYTRNFMLGEAGRYFKRDRNNEPNEYLFKLKALHYWSSEQLFSKALELLIDRCEDLKRSFLLLLQEKTSPITVKQENDHSYVFTLNHQTHTAGSLLQSHLSRTCIDKESLLLSCGYKQPHPLEDSLKLFISLNPTHKLCKDTELHRSQGIITFLMEQLDTLQGQFKELHELSESTF